MFLTPAELKDTIYEYQVTEITEGDDTIVEKEWLRIANAMIRYYFHLDPDILSDEEWAMRYNELIWVRKKEAGK